MAILDAGGGMGMGYATQDPVSAETEGAAPVRGEIGSPLEIPESQQKKIVDRLRKMHQYANRKISQLYDQWNDGDAQFIAYMADDKHRPTGKPQAQENPYAKRIYIPYTMANVMSTIAYIMQVFASQRPYVNLQPRGRNVRAAARMTTIVDAQADMMNFFLLLYQFVSDALKYGIGIMRPSWERTFRAMPVTDPLMRQLLGPETQEVDFDGPRTFNVDPFTYAADPMAPLGDPQKGEFVIYDLDLSYQRLLAGQASGIYFGVERVKRDMHTDGITLEDDPERTSGPERNLYRGSDDNGTHPYTMGIETDGVREWGRGREYHVKIIPSEWGVGQSNREQIWVFTVFNDKHLIRCHRNAFRHGKLQSIVWQPNFDIHAFSNPGVPWMTRGLQEVLNWLFNSHMESVRTSLNSMAVVDPQKINVEDLLRPQAGRLVRKIPGWEGDLNQAYQQIRYQDLTQGHAQDAQQVMDFWQRVTAIGDNQMGVVNPEKRTASEARIAAGASQGRMQLLAQLLSAQGIKPLMEMWISSNQQFLSVEREYSIVGQEERYADEAEGIRDGLVRIGRNDIGGFIDYALHDGSMPVDPLATSQEWQEIFATVATDPVLRQIFSIVGIFKKRVQAMPGEKKNLDDLILQATPQISAQVVPDNLNGVPDNANPVPMR